MSALHGADKAGLRMMCREHKLCDVLNIIGGYCTERMRDTSLTADERNYYRLLHAKIARAAGYAELHSL